MQARKLKQYEILKELSTLEIVLTTDNGSFNIYADDIFISWLKQARRVKEVKRIEYHKLSSTKTKAR